jgi:RimJ/RimL family protein N-acetyltransferase
VIDLEPWSERHLDALPEILADPDVHRFTRVPVPVPPDFACTWLARYEAARADGSREAFAVVDADTREFLGLAFAPRMDAEEQTAELGYLVAPSARGRGVAVEALTALTRWAFDTRGMHRLELLISVDNVASKRVAERCGYVLEGVMRSAYFKQGKREDVELWSRLVTDP